MARHAARSPRAYARTAGVLGSGIALFVLVGAGSAAALGPAITVQPRNADVQSRCSLTINSYNASTLTASTRLAAWAQPATLAGYATNTYTQVFCKVYGNAGNLLLQYSPYKNGPTVQTTSISAVIPYSSSYTVCGQAYVKKTGGTQSLTPVVCLTA